MVKFTKFRRICWFSLQSGRVSRLEEAEDCAARSSDFFTLGSPLSRLLTILLFCTVPSYHLIFNTICRLELCGRAMAQAVSRRPPTAEARGRSRVGPCGICGGQSGTGTDFSPVFPYQFLSTGAPLQGKTKKSINNLLHRVAQ
jgi:hypothetical protein